MQKESHNQRLKEIREKYGITPKETNSSLRTAEKQPLKNQSKYDDKYGLNKRGNQSSTIERKLTENVDPASTGFTTKHSALLLKEKQASQNYDSFLHTQSKEDRMKEIERIRQNVTGSRKQLTNDWTREAEISKSKYSQVQRYGGGLRQKTNTYKASNPQDHNRFSSFKDTPSRDEYRSKVQSSMSIRIEPDLELKSELRRNYDYEAIAGRQQKKQPIERKPSESPSFGSFRNDSVGRFDKQISALSAKKSLAYISTEFNSAKMTDSQSTSPIRGLMKLDSLEKNRRAEVMDTNHHSVSKFAATNYDMSNIDKIQERIQRILAKK